MGNVVFVLRVVQQKVDLFWTRPVTSLKTGFCCLSSPDLHQTYCCPGQYCFSAYKGVCPFADVQLKEQAGFKQSR